MNEWITPAQLITVLISLCALMLAVITTLVGLIVWFTRLDGKASQTKTDLECLEKEKVDELTKKFEAHRDNAQIHSSDLINYKLNTMERALDDVRAAMKEGFGELKNTLNKVLGIDK